MSNLFPPITGAGIGLRPIHGKAFLDASPQVGWCEVISDNYLSASDEELNLLCRVRERYPLSMHGVGMSLGSTDPLDFGYLKKLSDLYSQLQPTFVSEHLCWSSFDGEHLHDLLPLPFNEEVVNLLVENIGRVQDYFGRQFFVENISSYLQFTESSMTESDFLREISTRSGCGILLDLSNVVVNSVNHKFELIPFLESVADLPISEFHLGGFEEQDGYLLDTHSCAIDDRSWGLYCAAVEIIGPRPTLIEWDNDLPEVERVIAEVLRAQSVLDGYETRPS